MRITLDDLVGLDTVSPLLASFLAAAVKARLSIVVSGQQGDGKTTLLRILLGLMMLGSSLWLLSLLGNHVGQFWMLILMALMLVALLLAVVWRHGIRTLTLGLALS